MRFLADESCDFRLLRALRAADHDVVSVTETVAGASDEEVIALARETARILITEDRDFGQLFYAGTRPGCGVVLLRYPSTARASMVTAVIQLLGQRGLTLEDRFVVVEPGRIRIGRQP